MMKVKLLFLALVVLLASWSTDNGDSKNKYISYFYLADSVPKIYLFRDIANGLDEQFHRIYAVEDTEGKHIIVEIYTGEGRIIEALNYNVDSLDVMDHMVVNRKGLKTQAEVLKNKIIPANDNEEVWFATRFPGYLDSTFIIKEIKRSISGVEIQHEVMGKNIPTIVMKDKIKMTNFNPYIKKENVIEGEALNYFAKGYGLIEWHSLSKKVHFRLEKVFTQEEWIKIITRKDQ